MKETTATKYELLAQTDSSNLKPKKTQDKWKQKLKLESESSAETAATEALSGQPTD